MVNPGQWHTRYLTDAIETASAPQRLTMLYDAVEQDLARADAAFDSGDLETINDKLVHAQIILLALRDTVRPDVWDGAPQLIALLDYFVGELLGANLAKDRRRLADVAVLIGQIAGALRGAADNVSVTGKERVDVLG